MSYILDALKKSESERGHGNIPGVQTVHSSSINYHQQKKAIWPYFLIAAILLNVVVIAYFIYTQNDSTQTALTPTQDKAVLSGESQSYTAPVIHSPTVNPMPVKPMEKSLDKPAVAPVSRLTQTQPVSAAATQQTFDKQHGQKSSQKYSQTSAMLHNEMPGMENKEKFEPEPSSQQLVTESELINEPVDEPVDPPENEIILEQYELPEDIQGKLPALVISAHVYSSTPAQRSLIVNNEFFEEGDYIMDDVILHEITSDGAIFNYNGILFRNRSVSGWQ